MFLFFFDTVQEINKADENSAKISSFRVIFSSFSPLLGEEKGNELQVRFFFNKHCGLDSRIHLFQGKHNVSIDQSHE